MDFCDRAYVADFFEGKHVALVGSGPGILDNVPGFIDSHEIVIRVNNYRCTGRITGKRTDCYYSFFGTSIRKTASELQRDGVKLMLCKCPNGQFMDSAWHHKHNKMRGVDFRYIYEARRDFWFCPTYVPTVEEFVAHFKLLGGHVPTTGFAALLDVLSYKPASIYMSGYDFFQSGLHNLNQTWGPANAGDPIGHAPDAERAWLAENATALAITMDETLQHALNNAALSRTRKVSKVFRRRVV